MKITIKPDILFSVPEVVVICGVCEATVRKWVKDGKLRLGHSVSNQGAFLITGSSLMDHVWNDPRYNWRDYLYDIPEDRRVEYLLAAKDKCMRELSAAEIAMRKNRVQLDFVLHELFKEGS